MAVELGIFFSASALLHSVLFACRAHQSSVNILFQACKVEYCDEDDVSQKVSFFSRTIFLKCSAIVRLHVLSCFLRLKSYADKKNYLRH